MNLIGILRSSVLGVILLGYVIPVYAQDEGLCAPFRDGLVAPERVKAMLSAAENGHLYRIRNSTSRVGFCVDSKLSSIKAVFRDFQGGVSLWPDPGGQEQALIDIQTASLDAGNRITEHMLKSKGFFDVEHYPQILFVSTKIHWNDAANAVLKGKLTLHGVTRPVELQVHLTSIEKETDGRVEKVVARAGTVINRADFGMGEFSPLVDEKVRLCMTVEADRYVGLPGSAHNGAASKR